MKVVTETNTTARPAPDGPPGLEGGVTLNRPITNTGGGGDHDLEAIVPQVPYPNQDVEYTNCVSSGQSTIKTRA